MRSPIRPDSPQSRRRHTRRGSLLITALILAAVIAVSLGSFLNLAVQSSRLSYRSFYAGAAMNVAETGLEEGMWAVNKRLAGDTDVWNNTGWTTLSNGAVRRSFDLGTLSGGAKAEVKVFVSSANLVGATPFVIARSIITPISGPAVERWININLAKRSRFSTGLVAKDIIRFSGNNASVDSYDSRLGAYNASLGSGKTNKYDRGTAGSASVQVDSFNLGNADIWGFAVVGTSDASGLRVNNGTVGSFDTPLGTVDPNHVMTDFTANFEDIPHPASYTGLGAYTIASITSATTLPRATDLTPASDGKYYYNIGSIKLNGSGRTLTIADNVVIRMAGNISISTSLTINSPSALKSPALEIFTEHDFDVSGSGTVNYAGNPANFKLWGTKPQSASTTQSIKINGNGNLSAVVYAPKGDISMHGGGNVGAVYGAMVGNSITVTGHSNFHYDEALGEINSGEPLGMDEWNEYVSYADRAAYAKYMVW